MKRNQTKIIISVFLITVATVGIVGAYMFLHRLSPTETTYLYIDNDDNIDSIQTKLKATDAGISMTAFNFMARIKGYEQRIRPGRFEVSDKLNTLQLFRNIQNHHSIPINVLIPSVRNLNLLAGRLSSVLMADSLSLIQQFYDAETLEKMGYTRETIPALFIPNTYEIYWETSPKQLMRRMNQENKLFWNNQERAQKAEKIGMTKNEVVTLASIVDSETANNGEKARIAGLYMNRLHRNILLQSDPTVIFAIGDFSIRRVPGQMLQTSSSYNTYKVSGLPPGPIRIPSIAGIDAVLNYEHHSFLYMCAKEDFSGTHNFATTYNEHLVNARKYVKELNKRGIR